MQAGTRKERFSWDAVVGLLIGLCTFLVPRFLFAVDKNNPLSWDQVGRDFIFLVGILGIAVAVAMAAAVGLSRALKLFERSEALEKGMKELETCRTIAVPNEDLQAEETRAKLIRVVTPDLYSDARAFYYTILNNLKAHKRYRYIIPDKPEVKQAMHSLVERLRQDLGGRPDKELPIQVAVASSFPILSEYVVYDTGAFDGLVGFQEVRLGSDPRHTTNLRLSRTDALALGFWIDQHFSACWSELDPAPRTTAPRPKRESLEPDQNLS